MTVHTPFSSARQLLSAMLALVLVLGLASNVSAEKGSRPAPLPQPTEAQMGAPAYPGATYHGEISGGMSQDETYYWVFTTPDSAAKVAAFYKQKTGLVPMEIDGNFQFTIKKGDSPYFPDQGIVVEPNKTFTGAPKTAITFTKKK